MKMSVEPRKLPGWSQTEAPFSTSFTSLSLNRSCLYHPSYRAHVDGNLAAFPGVHRGGGKHSPAEGCPSVSVWNLSMCSEHGPEIRPSCLRLRRLGLADRVWTVVPGGVLTVRRFWVWCSGLLMSSLHAVPGRRVGFLQVSGDSWDFPLS